MKKVLSVPFYYFGECPENSLQAKASVKKAAKVQRIAWTLRISKK